MNFTIGINGRETNPHAACFEDFAKALASALRALGHTLTDFDNPGRMILFGCNNIYDPDNELPKDAIIFNTEQVAVNVFNNYVMSALEKTTIRLKDIPEAAVQMQNFKQFQDMTVWDYSKANAQALQNLGLKHVVHCPLGYIEAMSKPLATPEQEQDIDILWYGSLGSGQSQSKASTANRRIKILQELEARGARVVKLFGVYGDERDKVIARSKIVLNIHYYEGGIFEIFRCSHLIANKACVVSELGGCDSELEELAGKVTCGAEYNQLVDTCMNLLADSNKRKQIAEHCFEEFSKISLVKNVETALKQS